MEAEVTELCDGCDALIQAIQAGKFNANKPRWRVAVPQSGRGLHLLDE